MPKFSELSAARLATCDERLQRVFNKVVEHFDCTILEGHRSKEFQDLYFKLGKSKVKWPLGKHNSTPSRAVDAIPWPIDWNDTMRMTFFAGYVIGVASEMGIRLIWGHDWDGDTELHDQSFNDFPHFELKEN